MADFASILPPTGSLIRFTKLPAGSWATVGEPYRVGYRPHIRGGRKAVHATTSVKLWSEARECGTYDNAIMWANAKWEVVV